MSDEEWDHFCAITIKDNQCLEGEFTMPDGRRFATYGTMYGDGEYQDQYGNTYGVDAGLIGCIKLIDIKDEYQSILDSNLGTVIHFKNDFETSGGRDDNHWDGVIHIGHIMIETDPQLEENDYYVN